jgi:polar amino acid transport system substrate-binding protein
MSEPWRRLARRGVLAWRRLAPRARLAVAALLIAMLVAGGWLLARSLLGGRDATWERIRQTGVWRIGMDPSFPPFEMTDPISGRPAGFDAALAQAIADRWGARAEFIAIGFDQLVDAVAAHRVDSALSALPKLEHRAREVAFSAPYVEAGIVIAAPAAANIRRPEDLAGRRVAVEWGSEGDAEARALNRRLAQPLALALRDSAESALAAVSAGEADAALVDAISLGQHRLRGGALRPVGEPLRSAPYVLYVPVDAPALLGAVNEALAALREDGTLAALEREWLGVGD